MLTSASRQARDQGWGRWCTSGGWVNYSPVLVTPAPCNHSRFCYNDYICRISIQCVWDALVFALPPFPSLNSYSRCSVRVVNGFIMFFLLFFYYLFFYSFLSLFPSLPSWLNAKIIKRNLDGVTIYLTGVCVRRRGTFWLMCEVLSSRVAVLEASKELQPSATQYSWRNLRDLPRSFSSLQI